MATLLHGAAFSSSRKDGKAVSRSLRRALKDNRGSDIVVAWTPGSTGPLSKDAARAYSVKNVNKPWQRRRRADTTRFFCVSPLARVSIASKGPLSRWVINVRIMRGLPERRGLVPQIRSRFLVVRERFEKQYDDGAPAMLAMLKWTTRIHGGEERRNDDASATCIWQPLPPRDWLHHCCASAWAESFPVSTLTSTCSRTVYAKCDDTALLTARIRIGRNLDGGNLMLFMVGRARTCVNKHSISTSL